MDKKTQSSLDLMKFYFEKIKPYSHDKKRWGNDVALFAAIYLGADDTAKKHAESIYGVSFIKQAIEHGDEWFFVEYGKDYNKITNYDVPDDSWKLSAWGCANCYDNSSEKGKEKIIATYGKEFAEKALLYREEMHKRNRELYEAKFSKDIAKDITPIMPLLDNARGIVFYSSNKDKLYVFDEMPLNISSSIATKKRILRDNNHLSWEEENNVFSYEHGYLYLTYYSGNDSMILYEKKEKDIEEYVAGIYETVGKDVKDFYKIIDNLSSKLKDFNQKYFDDAHQDFKETKKFLRDKYNIIIE